MRRLLIPILVGLLAGACGILEPSEWERIIGKVGGGPNENVFAVPDSIGAGESFTIRFRTVGIPGERKGSTEVRYRGNVATIIPYDYRCSTQQEDRGPPYLGFRHEATVQFVEDGEAQVILIGRDPNRPDRVIQWQQNLRVYSQ